MTKRPLEKIIDGDRVIEPRFLKKPMLPYERVKIDDVIYFRSNDGYAVAKATVSKVENFENLNPEQVKQILDDHENEISPSEMMYDTKIYSKYATLIWMKNIQEIRPFYIDTPRSRHSWMVVDDINSLRSI